MGYYTSYGLSVHGSIEDEEAFNKDLLEISKYEDGPDPEVKDLIEMGGVWAKLYDLEGWIDELAPKYPNLLIILTGDGGESDDLWETRWKGAEKETQQAKIPPFDNENLWTEDEKENQNK